MVKAAYEQWKKWLFLHSNEENHISKDYGKIELLVNAAKAFARSTYQCVWDPINPFMKFRVNLMNHPWLYKFFLQ